MSVIIHEIKVKEKKEKKWRLKFVENHFSFPRIPFTIFFCQFPLVCTLH